MRKRRDVAAPKHRMSQAVSCSLGPFEILFLLPVLSIQRVPYWSEQKRKREEEIERRDRKYLKNYIIFGKEAFSITSDLAYKGHQHVPLKLPFDTTQSWTDHIFLLSQAI